MTDGLAKHDYDTGATAVIDGPDFSPAPVRPPSSRVPGRWLRMTATCSRCGGTGNRPGRTAAPPSPPPCPAAGGRVRLPARVPFGFHGSWADAAVLERATAASRGSAGTAGGEG